jgi:hypothetical protein
MRQLSNNPASRKYSFRSSLLRLRTHWSHHTNIPSHALTLRFKTRM